MRNNQPFTIEVLGKGSGKGSQTVVLDRVIGGTIFLDEAKRIGHRLFAITEGVPKAFRVVGPARQLVYEWHVGDEPKN